MVNSICICGAGTMGSGIAQAAAQRGLYTILYDLDPRMLDTAREQIEKDLIKLVEKEKLTVAEKAKILESIQFTNNIQTCLADFFIEAIVEKPQVKTSLFNQLAELNHSECVFATNTSSLSISEIAATVKNPERVIGMHFFNPAPVMKLVEIVRAKQTNEVTLNLTIELAMLLKKTPVVCFDSPGFIVNRVARPYYIESLRLAEQQLSDFAQTDRILEATGFKMGPFRLMDLIGNDINYAVSVSVYEQLGRPERLAPSPIQEALVQSGKLGKKSGYGYYSYTEK